MAEKRYTVTLYTDGSCSGNGMEHNVGGWAFRLDTGQHHKTGKGWISKTTNNAMELQAVIEGIRALKKPCDVKVVTDSTYICRVATEIRDFQRRGWHTKSGKRMSNFEGWMSLISLCKLGGHKLTFMHVSGHKGHPGNEECDRLARAAAREGKATLAITQTKEVHANA